MTAVAQHPGAPTRPAQRATRTAAALSPRTPFQPKTAPQTAPQPHRDRSIDLVRAVLLVIVVALHAFMVGVSNGPEGIVLGNATEGQDWFVPVTWFVQIMPLFFLIGGFSSITHWRRMREKGHSSSDYVISRMQRLVIPGVVLAAVIGVGLLAMTLAGVPADIVATAGFRISQPLWFLGVYILCSGLVPTMVRLHEWRPVTSMLALIGLAAAVDVARFATGIDAIGFANLLFVWLAVQQAGFWLADGRFERIRPRNQLIFAAAGLVALAMLTIEGPYSADMLQNLNPPTVTLFALGATQLFLFTLIRKPLQHLASVPRVSKIIDILGAHSMTVYLWHMPVLIVLAGGLLLSGVELVEPMSQGWWDSRTLWLAVVGLAVIPVARLFGRVEKARFSAPRVGSSALAGILSAVAVLLGAGGVLALLITGISLPGALIATGLMAASIGTIVLVQKRSYSSVLRPAN